MSYMEASVYLFIEYVNKTALNFCIATKYKGYINMEYMYTLIYTASAAEQTVKLQKREIH